MEWILPLLGGLGLVSLLKSMIDHFHARRAVTKDRLYQEMRKACIGLLGAYHKAAVRPSDENSKEFALWQIRFELFGSPEVSRFVQAIVDTNDGPGEYRHEAHRGMIVAMRRNL